MLKRTLSTIPKSFLYTRTGDKGTSILYTGKRLPKDSHIFSVLGNIDELNATLGLAQCRTDTKHKVEWIQDRLIELGSTVATPRSSDDSEKVASTIFNENHTVQVETWIDQLDSHLPPLTTFIKPQGHLHLARAVCRRTERSMIPLLRDDHVDPSICKFMNRLSDLLFVLGRTESSL